MDLANPTDRQCRQLSTDAASRRWIVALVLAVVAVRAVTITQPLVGNFATKQAAYAMIARNWAVGRAPIEQPTIDCLSSDGERAWHLMEWPATAYLTATAYRWFGGSIDVWGRSVGIACSALAVVFAYLFTQRNFDETAARATSLLVGFSPLSIAYGGGFLLEPSLVAYSFAAVYAIDSWLRGGRTLWLLLGAVAWSVAVATKIYMLLLAMPLGVLMWQARPNRRRIITAALAIAVAFAPTAAWYLWVNGVSATSGPAADYHPRGRAGVHAWPHPLLTSPSFYVHVLRDLATVALTPIGLVLFVVGVVDRRFRSHLPWLLSSLALLILLPLKFEKANYYYLILLPPIAIAVGLGWSRLYERFHWTSKGAGLVAAAGLLIAARYAIGPAYRVPAEDRSVTTAAAALRSLAAADEPVATVHGSTIDLLYYCDRPGWALNGADPQLVNQLLAARNAGAKRLVVANLAAMQSHAEVNAWLQSRPIEAAGDDWAIFQLATEPSPALAVATPAAESRSRPEPRTAKR